MAEFALGKRLPLLAVSAYEKMRLPPPAIERAEKFMRANRPDLAIRALPEVPGTDRERVIMARIHERLGDHLRCLRLLEPLFLSGGKNEAWQKPTVLTSPGGALLRVWKSGDRNVKLALQAAEVVMAESPLQRDVELLGQFAAAYPEEKRLLWLNYRAQIERHEYREAAGFALKLAEQITRDQ